MSSCDNVTLSGCLAVDIGDYWNPTFMETFEVTDPETGEVTDEPFNFTGYTVRMRIRQTLEGADVFTLTEQVDNQTTGIYFSDKTTGTFQAIIMGADSPGTPAGAYLYEIGVTDPDGNEKIFLNGQIVFKQVF